MRINEENLCETLSIGGGGAGGGKSSALSAADMFLYNEYR